MPDSPAKIDAENQQSPSGSSLRADATFKTPSDANATMRSIPSPLLVHSKKHVKDDTLRKFTDYSRHGKGKHKMEKSGSVKGKRILPRLSESSPTREDKNLMAEMSLHDRRHVQPELVVDIDKANSLVTDADTNVVEKDFTGPNLNQSSSVYTTASIPTEFFLSSQGTDDTEFDLAQYKSIENAVYMRPSASPRRHNSGGSIGMPKTSSSSFPAILTSQSSEYTTITDEIDTSCIIDTSPPRSPSTAGSFFADGYNDGDPQRRSSVVTSEENARLKQAEDMEHRKMERVIRHRLRQISLDDTDSISDIARLVVSELQTNEEDHSGHDEDPDDIHGSMESCRYRTNIPGGHRDKSQAPIIRNRQ
ncbi:hypothetical protein FSP39_000852 [Pinctada imbricata]|uniref:Uncharacterized protein n=1 Tax=Pinctada imbricata TaxID=66713 RepID=A0AA89BUH7_PINIB|nr:hypothetical protein FSP39_000852 [Pinctada imbricata]